MAGVSVTEEFDYEDNPDRFRVNQEVVNRYGLVGDVHDEVAARVAKEIAPLIPRDPPINRRRPKSPL